MASEKETNLYLLNRARDIFQRPSLESLSKIDMEDIQQVYKLFLTYAPVVTNKQIYNIITDLKSFFEVKPYEEIDEIKEAVAHPPSKEEKKEKKKEEKETKTDESEVPVEEEEEKKKEEIKKPPTTAPAAKKEDSTVPAELASLMEAKRQADLNKAQSDNTHSVADAVKRARNAWMVKHQEETIRENRLKQIADNKEKQAELDKQDDEREKFIVSTVDPKETSSRNIYKNLRLAAEEAIRVQNPKLSGAALDKAIENLTYLTISGAIDIENPQDFYIGTQLSIKEAGVEISKELDQLDELQRSYQSSLETDPFSDKPDEIQNQINLTDAAIAQRIKDEALQFPEKIQEQYKDYDLHFPEAVKTNRKIQNAYSQAIPVTGLSTAGESPLQQKAGQLEADIRKNVPDALNISPTAGGAKYIGLLQVTQSGNRNLSPEAVKLLSLGLTGEKLDAAQKDASSPLGKLYHSKEYGEVFKQVHFQIKKIQASAAGKEIEKDLRPVGAMDKFFNRLSPTAQNATKLILNPRGTITSWASRQSGKMLGQSLIDYSGSAAAQKIGGYLLEEGLAAGVKKFTTQAAGKLAVKAGIWVATRLGWSAIAESLNAILPGGGVILDIIGQVVIWIAEKTIGAVWNKFQSLHREMYGDDFSFKEASVPIIAAGVTLASIGAAAMGTFIALRRSTQIAIVSAAGIIIMSVATVVFYVSFSYLVAPILSTLVQLDSKEKVKYEDYSLAISSSDCGWPTTGHYSINTGPLGGTHYRSKLEAIDIGAPDLSPHLSATDGVVFHAGPFSNYGKTIGVHTTNAAGSFEVYYGHLSRMDVGIGAKVKKGQQIGLVGGDGGWDPHIHMEYKGIKYNQCPAGGLQIREYCCTYNPMPAPPRCQGACNAFSN